MVGSFFAGCLFDGFKVTAPKVGKIDRGQYWPMTSGGRAEGLTWINRGAAGGRGWRGFRRLQEASKKHARLARKYGDGPAAIKSSSAMAAVQSMDNFGRD